MRWAPALAFIGPAVGVMLLAWGVAAGLFVPAPVSQQTIFARGQVIHVQAPGGLNRAPVVEFTVVGKGAAFTGEVHWDHSSAAFVLVPSGSAIACPAEWLNVSYVGSAWNQSWDQSLTPGQYDFGAVCDGYGNATVVNAVQLTAL
jgi:hypothetical protein